MQVLVTYGSERGSTAGIAETLAVAIHEHGFDVDVCPVDRVRDVTDYDAVVVGGALYAGRWHRDARRFVRRHQDALGRRRVWMFSSGPLDESAAAHDIPPVPGVRALMEAVGAQAHVTFSGSLSPDARGLVASRKARRQAGDWRDDEHILGWGEQIAAVLRRDQSPVDVSVDGRGVSFSNASPTSMDAS